MNIVIVLIFACVGVLLVFLKIKKQQSCTGTTTGKVIEIHYNPDKPN